MAKSKRKSRKPKRQHFLEIERDNLARRRATLVKRLGSKSDPVLEVDAKILENKLKVAKLHAAWKAKRDYDNRFIILQENRSVSYTKIVSGGAPGLGKRK